MIQLSGAGKRYGHKLLFENADWLITPESRIGLVGANGTGKSTVMKILAGSESLDYGTISRAKGISTGYLPQDGLTMTGRTIFAECLSVFAELDAIAAVIIGGASFFGGRGTAGGVFIGAVIMGLLRNGLNLMNVSVFWQQVLLGFIILLAVYLDVLRRRAMRLEG